MKYMLLIYMTEDALSQPEREQCYVKSAQLAQQLPTNGQFLGTAPLQPVALTKTVQVRDGKSFQLFRQSGSAADAINGFVPSGLDNPGAWKFRDAVGFPLDDSNRERFLRCFFGHVEIANQLD